MSLSESLDLSKVVLAEHLASSRDAPLKPFHVSPATSLETLPFGSDRPLSKPGFRIRGIKGWTWSESQYLSEIPILAKYRLNFLMNDYGSLWELGPHGEWANDRTVNFWYQPFSEEKKATLKKVIHACKQHNIMFCFSMNPNLKSDRPFNYDNPKDLNVLWQHYEWVQRQGVKWFNISLDDIHENIDAAGQARLVNKIFQRLRANDSEAQLAFCPTWYAGTGDSGVEINTTLGSAGKYGDTPGIRYTKTLSQQLHPDVYLFWTGPRVCSLSINANEALRYKSLAGHRILLWDNYPVNDHNPALHLGPLTGRSADLCTAVEGYISNPMSPQNEANRIPLLTIADYLWSPVQYDPRRSISQSIVHLGQDEAQRKLLRDLVELYPGRLWDNSEKTSWNSLRARFYLYIRNGEKGEAADLLGKAKATLLTMKAMFSDDWTSGTKVLQQDVDAMARVCRQSGGHLVELWNAFASRT